MPHKMLNAKLLKALRLIRSGSEPAEICNRLKITRSSMRSMEIVCRNVPDDILVQFEQALGANEKLRRLIAGLGHSP